MSETLRAFSSGLAAATELAGRSVVRVDEGTRLTASGIVWDEQTVVATSHGVERDEDLFIETGDGLRIPATVAGRDDETDLVVLRVAGGLTPIRRAPSAQIGELVLALGRPGTSGLYATLGILGAMLPAGIRPEGHLLQTDADFYPGFSGGALVNVEGQLLGMINLRYGRGRGLAVDLTVLNDTVGAILAYGKVPRGYLGVRSQPAGISAALQQRLQLEQTTALLVVHVEEGSPAETGGLLIGDAILSIAAQPTGDGDEIREALRGRRPGDIVPVKIIRGGALVEVPVTLAARS